MKFTSELEFFFHLFPQTYEHLHKTEFVSFDGGEYPYPKSIDDLDKPRREDEAPVCECVGENTNKALVLYFQSIIKQGIELPIFINNKNQVMDGYHRIMAYSLMDVPYDLFPVYRNKLWRNHGFCWKIGLDGRRRLRTKTW